MKLYERKNVKQGDCFPKSWLSWGRTSMGGGYIRFGLPLFVYRRELQHDFRGVRCGWFIPTITILKDRNQWALNYLYIFHSRRMDECSVEVPELPEWFSGKFVVCSHLPAGFTGPEEDDWMLTRQQYCMTVENGKEATCPECGKTYNAEGKMVTKRGFK